jgi:hypothetical protein
LAPNVTPTTVITPPDDLSSYNFSTSLETLSDADFFLDDTAASAFADDTSTFNFNIPPLIPSDGDGGGVNDTTPSLDSTGFTLWEFDPPSSDSASFMTGQAGLESTARPTPQTWGRDTTTPRDQDQDHGGAPVNIDAEGPVLTASRGPERIPDVRRRTNWRIDREDEQASDSSATYDPLLEDFAGAMSRGKKDRHLQEQAAAIMKTLMVRSQACCNGGGQSELERQDVDFASLPVHEIIDGNTHVQPELNEVSVITVMLTI